MYQVVSKDALNRNFVIVGVVLYGKDLEQCARVLEVSALRSKLSTMCRNTKSWLLNCLEVHLTQSNAIHYP